ncbi:MAG: hypothetical protein HZB22_08180 [Deltaproteobacteria bacterium]|nr:hypothetical protein [Deltaproteobacteria bacterium]
MDEDVKICPQCGAEYFPHIMVCAACEVPLIRPAEAPKMDLPDPAGSLVCVEEGDIHRVTELVRGLGSAGIEYEIMKIDGGGACSKSADYGIFVDSALAGPAVRVIDEFLRKVYPELKDAQDRRDEGVCPACGADVRGSTSGECPDCGLNLGGGGPGGDTCGGCGPGYG